MKNKKIITAVVTIIVIALILILGYFAMLKVEQNKVASTIEETFTNLKSSENNDQKEELLEEIKNNTEEENGTEDSIDYTVLFNKLDYSIIENKANFKEADVVIDITNKDMKQILGNYLVKIFQLAFSNAFTNTYSDEQMNEELANYLKEQMESEEIDSITTQITLKMEKQDGKWIIKEESKEEFVNAVLPGFLDTINEINSSVNENVE